MRSRSSCVRAIRLLPYLLDTIRDGPGTRAAQRESSRRSAAWTRKWSLRCTRSSRPRDDEDFKDTNLRLAVLEIFRRRADMGCIPYLWHMSSSPKIPDRGPQQGPATLGYLREAGPGQAAARPRGC